MSGGGGGHMSVHLVFQYLLICLYGGGGSILSYNRKTPMKCCCYSKFLHDRLQRQNTIKSHIVKSPLEFTQIMMKPFRHVSK